MVLLLLFHWRHRRYAVVFFFSSRRRHTRCSRDWSSDVCSSDLGDIGGPLREIANAHPDTIIGSYPFQDEEKKPNTNLVVRSRDPEKLNAAMNAVKEMLAELNVVR